MTTHKQTDIVSGWAGAQTALQQAKTAYDRHCCEVHDPAYEAGKFTAEIGRENDRLGHMLAIREHAIIQVPAPNFQALLWKLEQLRKVAEDSVVEADDFDNLIADLRRLSGAMS
ncbi:hypothetical protein [Novosphingobium capsulatum]|uniref:hypothetical protein n=1 Tax=Novosphingobium capsulatum TaxID=13688 RepID=UPI000786FDBA|nr:hypothetical protein [Novosphingobium capsulatum]WQD92741.1 hypothetical protein U0041_17430 [Novosphingobium capsulatum]